MLGEGEEVKEHLGLRSMGQAVIVRHMSCAVGCAVEKVLHVCVCCVSLVGANKLTM